MRPKASPPAARCGTGRWRGEAGREPRELPSSPRTRGGGFTLEVQHLGKGLSWGSEVKAFTRSVVVGGHEVAESAARERRKVGLAGHEAAHSPDCILDAAFLPRRIRIAKEGVDRQAAQREVAGGLGTVVEGDGLAERLR